MSALTDNRITQSRDMGRVFRALMTVSKTIYSGSLVMAVAAGTSEAAAASASNKGIAGVATEKKVSPASGATWIKLQEGIFLFGCTSVAQTAVLGVVYAQDDQTVDETQGANEPRAGYMTEFVSATSGWIAVGIGNHV